MSRVERSVIELSTKLKELVKKAESSNEAQEEVKALLNTISTEYADNMTIALLAKSGLGKVLTKIGKSKILASPTKETSRSIVVKLKNAADLERAAIAEEKRMAAGPGTTPEPPRSNKEYHRRLVDQNTVVRVGTGGS
jgi:ABC-type glutathione transport system ATPase component